MRSIYLPIRSFGDFLITASVVKDHFSRKVPVILPDYMTGIFEAINGDQFFEVAGTIPYKNQPAFFELYRIKDLSNIKRLVKDVLILRSSVNKSDHYLLDYSSRRISFTGAHFSWPSKKVNIYQGKEDLMTDTGFIGKNSYKIEIPDREIKNVIIIPDSRVSEKSITNGVINSIIKAFGQVRMQTAIFSKARATASNVITYASFPELIALISAADLVISAESLPYHLANFLAKPHFVIYNKSRHFKATFMTPYMLHNQRYAIYDGDNVETVINALGAIL